VPSFSFHVQQSLAGYAAEDVGAFTSDNGNANPSPQEAGFQPRFEPAQTRIQDIIPSGMTRSEELFRLLLEHHSIEKNKDRAGNHDALETQNLHSTQRHYLHEQASAYLTSSVASTTMGFLV